MDRTYFGGVERGERNVAIDNIERIAAGLNINPYLLLVDQNLAFDNTETLAE